MKKKAKKLVLAKETLRELDPLNLERIAAQGITDVASCIGTCGSVYLSCACTPNRTSHNTCGSAYC
jgi:hypothetical protein